MSFKNLDNNFKEILENTNQGILPIKKEPEGKRKSYTFSLSETEHDMFVKESEKRGFKNKSEFLKEIIKQLIINK